ARADPAAGCGSGIGSGTDTWQVGSADERRRGAALGVAGGCYIPHVLNVQDKVSEAQRGFIEGFGHLYARYGVSITFGRLFGLLLVSNGPLSLDDIADILGISKSGASAAARELERAGVIKRHGTPGSRRIVYDAVDDMEPVFAATFTRVRDSLALLKREEPTLADGRGKKRV